MRRNVRLIHTLAAFAVLASPALVEAQAMSSAEPFKVGTFGIDGARTVGLVLRDALIVDIAAANRALEMNPDYATVAMPDDMLELIGQYEYGLRYRLYDIVNHLVEGNMLTGNARPAYVHDVADVDIQAPIQYPSKIMNAAVNFYTHACEGCTEEQLRQRTLERQQNRGVPYLFLKPTRGAVIGDGEDIIMPFGRDEIEYEVELAIVFGRTGKYVSAARAYDYVFGYMAAMDVSDRGGRPPGGYGSGSDWFVGKGHDTFAPHGPWIVPKEFYGDPMQELLQQTIVDGIARELHDAVSQTLFSAKIIAESLPALLEKDSNAVRAGLNDLMRLTLAATSEMRVLLMELRPNTLTHTDLGKLLTYLVDGAKGRTLASINLQTKGQEPNLPFNVKINLYRIAQEALNNIIKHAQAEHVTMILTCDSESSDTSPTSALLIVLQVRDDGCGFLPDQVTAEHMGLRIMRERAAESNISLEIKTAVNQGTIVEAAWGAIPL
jgi:2-keto-4-pentenoate hydratase/2-oxohepta-3-ene-1,7-dioic acid hydratase in catechol pathway/two-component sensor histidine kinase